MRNLADFETGSAKPSILHEPSAGDKKIWLPAFDIAALSFLTYKFSLELFKRGTVRALQTLIPLQETSYDYS
jgi:hypothetical protein